jgi:UDP-GlcNAc:undecaprenyl-phosphate/decaprenyl-phosphate GlcNAc-1-phosphate transferase
MLSGDEIRIAGALLTAFAVTLLATPVAWRVALRTGFLDHPVGYKEHPHPTPYLGGAAVIAGILVAMVVSGVADDYKRLVTAALVLFAIGTLDDRIGLGVGLRLIAQVATAVALWAVNLGWTFLPGEAADLVLTILWVVGITNAFNLLDNLDGATGTVAGVCGAGAGALALVQGDQNLAMIGFAITGACAAFLHYNLARPARIFLGDGGSMPLGLLVACAIMAIPDGALDWTLLFATVPLAGLPILDTTLVVVSRIRRGEPVLSGGRDHLTHRLLRVAGSERRVALILAISQAALSGLSVALFQLDHEAVAAAAAVYLVLGAAVIALLETVAAVPARVPARGERPA